MPCNVILKDGQPCPNKVTHRWGNDQLHNVDYCCEHFDKFCEGLLNWALRLESISRPKHTDIVEEYVRQCHCSSLSEGSDCESEKKSEQ
jgi:hypothetical protein